VTLSAGERERVEAFEAAYHAIEELLKERLGLNGYEPVRAMIDAYAERHPTWRHGATLAVFAQLRHLNTHERTEPGKAVAVPTAETLAEIQAIRESLSRRIIDACEKAVFTVSPGETLTGVLRRVRENGVHHFPVFDGSFRGLLTEQGVTRYLARHGGGGVRFDDVTVGAMLGSERKKGSNVMFVRPEAPVDDVLSLFSSRLRLEAVLITESGEPGGELLGMATRGDAVRLLDEDTTDGRS